MRRVRVLSTLLLVPALSLAGCEAEEPGVETAPPLDQPVLDTAPGAAAPPTTAAPGTQAGAVRAVLDEWTVRLERDTLSAGQATFNVVNEGEYTHAFEVEGQGQEWETENIQPGGQATLTADLQPGSYEVYCPIVDQHGNHRELGMRTTLVVR